MKKLVNYVLSTAIVFTSSLGYSQENEYEERGSIKIPSKEESQKIKRSDKVVNWRKVQAKKGYILSNDLYFMQHCTPTWSKHVKVFKQKNPNIENPHIIPIGAKFEVQECEKADAVAAVETVPTKSADPISEQSKKTDLDKGMNTVYIDLYGGLITEEKKEDTSFLLGAGVHGDLYKHLGYDLRILWSEIVATTKGEVRFKTEPDRLRYVLLYGMGNRIGIKNSDLDRINKGVDAYSYLGLGLEMRPTENHFVVLDVNHNLSSGSNFNVSATAQKRVGDDKWLGVFIEYQSTKSPADTNDADRRYLSGGLKYSF